VDAETVAGECRRCCSCCGRTDDDDDDDDEGEYKFPSLSTHTSVVPPPRKDEVGLDVSDLFDEEEAAEENVAGEYLR